MISMHGAPRSLLVTGASGFVGQHLFALAEVAQRGYGWRLSAVSDTLNLTDAAAVDEAIAATRPAAVLHLAGQSNVPIAFRDPAATLNVNVIGTQHLISAMLRHVPKARLVFVSSGDVYGLVAEADLPISEGRVPEPRNPYAVSKVAAECLVRSWHFSDGLNAVIARPFNHIGAGQADTFAISSFAKQVVEIKLGLREPVIAVGDLDVARDFTDVADVVEAYLLLANKGEAGVIYNVASDVEIQVRTLLERLFALSGVTATIAVDPTRLRPGEQRRARGDAGRLRALGWQAQRSLDQSLATLLADWEARLTK